MVTPERVSIILYKKAFPQWIDIRCIHCQRKLCNLNHRPQTISFDEGLPAGASEDALVFEHKCRGCNTIYKFCLQYGEPMQ